MFLVPKSFHFFHSLLSNLNLYYETKLKIHQDDIPYAGKVRMENILLDDDSFAVTITVRAPVQYLALSIVQSVTFKPDLSEL